MDAVVASAAPDATVPSVAMADETRKLIRTVQLEMVVAHVDSVSRWAQDLSARMGGYSTDVNVWEQDGVPHAVLTLRVPATRLEASLAQLRAWSKRVEHEQQSVQDVTDQFVDVEARLRTLKSTEKELLLLLDESRQRNQKLDGILAVYRELTEIRSRIEQLQGQRDALSDGRFVDDPDPAATDEKAHPVMARAGGRRHGARQRAGAGRQPARYHRRADRRRGGRDPDGGDLRSAGLARHPLVAASPPDAPRLAAKRIGGRCRLAPSASFIAPAGWGSAIAQAACMPRMRRPPSLRISCIFFCCSGQDRARLDGPIRRFFIICARRPEILSRPRHGVRVGLRTASASPGPSGRAEIPFDGDGCPLVLVPTSASFVR